MRILKQLSLDSALLRNTLSPTSSSRFSFDFQSDRLNETFARRLFEAIAQTSASLRLLAKPDQDKPLIDDGGKKNEKHATSSMFSVLNELNSLIVFLLQLSGSMLTIEKAKGKVKTKIKRQYSAFVSSKRKSTGSIINNDGDELDSSALSLSCTPSSSTSQAGCTLSQAVHQLITSQIIFQLLKAMASLGFEEKKQARMIVTNSMMLEVSASHPVIDYICQSHTGILSFLVSTYQTKRSDVTLNCGRIIRFACKFEDVVETLLVEEHMTQFFDHMRCSSSQSNPFDVTMDMFYTFKVLLTKHKQATSRALLPQCDRFFTAFTLLLAQAESSQDYVTKRQLMEVFTDLFAGSECTALRKRFVAKEEYLFPILAYLCNRNIQIRYRCLALVNQLFRVYSATPEDATSSVSRTTFSDEERRSTPTSPSPRKKRSFSLKSLKKRILTPQSSVELCEWNLDELVSRLRSFLEVYHAHTLDDKVMDSAQIYDRMVGLLQKLRVECEASNLAQFSAQVTFLNQTLECVRSIRDAASQATQL